MAAVRSTIFSCRIVSVEDSAKAWAKINRCAEKPTQTKLPAHEKGGMETKVETYDGCQQAAQVVSYSASVKKTRGYAVSDFDQRAADISVDHPRVVENYRSAHEIALRVEKDKATTEDLRTATIHYRSLFEELVQVPTIVERKEVA